MVQDYTFDITKAAVFGLNWTSLKWEAQKNFTIPKWGWLATWFRKDDLPWVKYDNYSRLLIRYRISKSLKMSIKDGPENDFKYFTPRFILWCLFWFGHFTVRDWCFDFRIYRINHNIKVVHSLGEDKPLLEGDTLWQSCACSSSSKQRN